MKTDSYSKQLLLFLTAIGLMACSDLKRIDFTSEEYRETHGAHLSSSSETDIDSSSSTETETSSSSDDSSSSSSSLNECESTFNPQSAFCYDGTVYAKCDGMEYNPTTHICEGIVASPAKCNGIQYNPLTEFCQTGTNAIKPFCGTATYTSSQFCDTRDSKTYKWVKIGNDATAQTWMAENLNYNASSGSWCYTSDTYPNAGSNCDNWGRIYNWAAAMVSCPEGWHLPSDAEWATLKTNVGNQAGNKLKAENDWIAYNGIENLDTYSFSALPGGYRYPDGNFGFASDYGYWWSATEYDTSDKAYYHYMLYNHSDVSRYYDNKSYGFSVRCVKDENNE